MKTQWKTENLGHNHELTHFGPVKNLLEKLRSCVTRRMAFFEEEEILLLTSLGSGNRGIKMLTFKTSFLSPGRVTACLESYLEVIKLDWTLTCVTPAIQISYLVYKGGKEGPPLLVMQVTAFLSSINMLRELWQHLTLSTIWEFQLSSQISANCSTKSKERGGGEGAKLLKNWHKETLCKKRWSKNKTRN